MEILCRRVPGGLAPESDEEAAKLGKLKAGASVRVNVTQEVNAKFRRKWWALAQYAFGLWSETMPEQQYRGQEVQPNFERFRKDLTILAGHFHPVWTLKGEMRVEANSLSWARMTDEAFDALYSATIDAVLAKILTGSKLTEADLRAHVDRVMEFDR
jgi:hypothetical protein